MTQEKEVRSSQIASGNDIERLKSLQRLQKQFDPFSESEEGKKLRAVGLKNLSLQMIDPSVEFIEKVSIGLGNLPTSNLHQLYADVDWIGENPRKFFVERGVVIEDPEKLQEGLNNSFQLIQEIIFRHDFEAGKINWGESLDSKGFAESVHEQIQVGKGERQFRKVREQIKIEINLERRYRMGLKLKKQVLEYVNKFPFKFTRGIAKRESFEPTWENLVHPGWHTEFRTKQGGSISGSFGIQDTVETANAAIMRRQLEKRLERLPTIDKEQFNELRLRYGAKAANLIILSKLVGNINKATKDNFDRELAVPDFQAMPVDFYRTWKDGKLTDEDLRPYFEWANGLKEKNNYTDEVDRSSDYIARSSAVFSEDGEKLTGAGIYESVKVYGGGTFQDFKNAITKVYESTDSPRAQAYRELHGIKQEEMGLIIQKFIDTDNRFSLNNQSQEGYVNTRLTGVPQLMEIVTKTSRNFVKRKELDYFLALRAFIDDETFKENIHHFPADAYKADHYLITRIAQLTLVIEKMWKKDVQIEFLFDGSAVNFVQVRELPADMFSQASGIQFLDDQPIHSGASIGVGDIELPVLDNEEDNSKKVGVVIFSSNYMFSMGDNSWHLPKEGAVIIYRNDEGKNGHIQTLCAEKGLICIFPDMNERDRSLSRYDELFELKRARIIANGIEGRVYPTKNKNIVEELLTN